MQSPANSPMVTDTATEQLAWTQLQTIWQHIQQRLEAEKQRVFEEIRHYPPPIPACDAQFNGLLEERAAIQQALGQVNSILKQNPPITEQIEFLNALMLSSRDYTDGVAAQIAQLTGLEVGSEPGRAGTSC